MIFLINVLYPNQALKQNCESFFQGFFISWHFASPDLKSFWPGIWNQIFLSQNLNVTTIPFKTFGKFKPKKKKKILVRNFAQTGSNFSLLFPVLNSSYSWKEVLSFLWYVSSCLIRFFILFQHFADFPALNTKKRFKKLLRLQYNKSENWSKEFCNQNTSLFLTTLSINFE